MPRDDSANWALAVPLSRLPLAFIFCNSVHFLARALLSPKAMVRRTTRHCRKGDMGLGRATCAAGRPGRALCPGYQPRADRGFTILVHRPLIPSLCTSLPTGLSPACPHGYPQLSPRLIPSRAARPKQLPCPLAVEMPCSKTLHENENHSHLRAARALSARLSASHIARPPDGRATDCCRAFASAAAGYWRRALLRRINLRWHGNCFGADSLLLQRSKAPGEVG